MKSKSLTTRKSQSNGPTESSGKRSGGFFAKSRLLPTPWNPHAYQKKAVKFLLEHAEAGLFLDPGLGKTSITLAALKVLKKTRGGGKGALVVAPLRVVYTVWPKEILRWSDFTGLSIGILHGKGKEDVLAERHDLYVINPEGLTWLLQNDRMKKLLTKVDTLVVDELSKFKHANTGRFKALKPWLPKFGRRWGLTGSPASNGLLDLFGQCYVLDLGKALGRYITHYRFTFFNPTGYGGYTWVPKAGAQEAIYKQISPLALRMDAKDYLELPELVTNTIAIELPEKARELYAKLEDEFFAEFDGGQYVTILNAASASTKLRQVANGGLYVNREGEELSSQREWVDVHAEKVEAVRDLVDELQGSPLLVAYEYEHDLDRLRKAFGKNTPYIGGGVTAKRTQEIVEAWNAGEIPILLGHPQAMGHGLNLQASGHHIAWHSLTWDYELYDQFIRRVYRQGNKSQRVFVHHIVARETVDEAVLRALLGKRRTQNALLDALKEYGRSRKSL